MQTRNFKGPACAGTVPLKPKIRPLQTWPSEQSASLAPLEAAPAHGSSSARGQRGADGRGWVRCQESLRAAWPSSNPPPRSRGKRQLGEGSFKTPTQSYSQAKSPSSFKGRLRTDLHGGIPRTGSSLLQPLHESWGTGLHTVAGTQSGALLTPASQTHSAQKKSIF